MKIKNLLLGLFGGLIIFLGLSSFCSAGQYTYQGVVNGNINMPIPQTYITKDFNMHCVFNCSWNGSSSFYFRFSYYFGDSYQATATSIGSKSFSCGSDFVYDYDFSTFSDIPYEPIGIAVARFTNISNYGTLTYNCTFSGDNIISVPICSPQYTSEECQSEYGLVSSGVLNNCQSDLQSCQSSLSGWDNSLNNCSNNLLSCQSSLSSCIAGNCPLDDGDVQWSSLFINNIQHIGAPLININIPEEISWDYTSSTGSFDLDVEGYNVDADYIEGVINIQNSKPTKEDFNKIITQLLPLFVPGLVIILFIYFVFYLIKKIFK